MLGHDRKRGYQPDTDNEYGYSAPQREYAPTDEVFGNEEGAQIHYRTMSWPLVAALMIAEILSNGMLSLPSSLAVVGVVPGVMVIVLLGAFATFTSWLLILVVNGAAFVLAVGVPIFNYLIGIAASLFASWSTYGIAWFFWLHDAYHFGLGRMEWSNSWGMTMLSVLTIIAGLFICVAGLYVTVDGIVVAYQDGTVSAPFSC